MTRPLVLLILLTSFCLFAMAQTKSLTRNTTGLPPGYWPMEQSQPIIDKTQTIRLTPDISHLTPGERLAVEKLIEVGKIFQGLYENQRHPQASSASTRSRKFDKRLGSPQSTQNLLTLYRSTRAPSRPPWKTRREPFCPSMASSPERMCIRGA